MAKSKTESLSGNNLLIALVLISLLVVGVSGLVTKALITTIIRDTKVREAGSKANAQLDKNLQSAPQLVAAYAALGENKDLIADALPNTSDFPGLIVLFENLATDAGVKLKSVAPVLAAATDDAEGGSATVAPKTYAFSVTVDGNYEAMRKLLSNIELSARPMRVTGIELNGSSSALTGEIGLETYYQDKAELPFSKETIK